jgi:2-dehydropantoate 2-reductase
MDIVVFGAGAIGSLFGALLSKRNDVLLVGRRSHVDAIRRNGLHVEGETVLTVKVPAVDKVNDIDFSPDLLILTVKSYDTEEAISEAKRIIGKDTIVLSLQNGLDNVDKIERVVDRGQVIAGVTTHGVVFSAPGFIKHTGKGLTVLGELDGERSGRVKRVVSVFNDSGIETVMSVEIVKEMWVKAIVNSCINPLTTFFQCRNGYLLENPVLEEIVERVCKESTSVAVAFGLDVSYGDMVERTKEVIRRTSDNYSSMFQSFQRGRRTEIGSINGRFVDVGRMHGVDVSLNEILVFLVESLYRC